VIPPIYRRMTWAMLIVAIYRVMAISMLSCRRKSWRSQKSNKKIWKAPWSKENTSC
jgi:hypothetical protein